MSAQEQLWGGETTKAVDNFPVSGETVPVAVVRWLGRVKGAAARANADLGLLDSDLAGRIAEAADAIARGDHDAQPQLTCSHCGDPLEAHDVTPEPSVPATA